MPAKFGFLLLKPNRPDLTELLERFARLMQIVGSAPKPEPPPGVLPPMQGGHIPTQLKDGRIWTPEGIVPPLLNDALQNIWPIELWTDAARVSYYESTGWKRDAALDTRHFAGGRCNVPYTHPQFGRATTEYSIGYFQINSCAHGGTFEHWIDPTNNVRKAWELFEQNGWHPWTLTARKLNLL